jgi:hypothetical protein
VIYFSRNTVAARQGTESFHRCGSCAKVLAEAAGATLGDMEFVAASVLFGDNNCTV